MLLLLNCVIKNVTNVHIVKENSLLLFALFLISVNCLPVGFNCSFRIQEIHQLRAEPAACTSEITCNFKNCFNLKLHPVHNTDPMQL